MSNLHEIAFKIKGIIDNTLPKSFADVTSKLGALQAKIKESTGSGNSWKQKIDETNRLKFEMEKAISTQGRYTTTLDKQKQSLEELQAKYQPAIEKARRLREEVIKSENPNARQIRDYEKARAAADKMQSQLSSLRNKISETTGKISEQSKEVDKLTNSYGKASNESNKFEKRQKVRDKISEINAKNAILKQKVFFAKELAMNTISMGNFMVEPIKQAMHFETVMSEVKKLVHFDSAKEFEEMSNQLKNMSTTIPVAADGLAHIMASAAQAGIHKPDLVAFTKDAATMATAWSISADQAGDIMAKWRSAFQLSQPQVVNLGDQVHLLSDNTAATSVQIAEAVSRIGNLGKIAGITTTQIAAMAATSIGAGVQTEVAATAIKKVILTVASGESLTKGQVQAFDKLGVNAVKFAKDVQTRGLPAILDLFDLIRKLPIEKQAGALKNMFGEESIGTVAGMMANLDQLRANLTLVNDETKYLGLSAKEAGIRAATTANSIQLLKNNIAAVAITVGNMFLPAINSVVQTISKVVNTIRPFIEQHQTLVKWIGFTVAALAGITVAVASVSFLFSGAIAIILKLRVAYMAITAATWLWNTALLANPITLIVAGIVALGAVIAAVVIYWKEITAAVGAFGTKVQEIIKTAIQPLLDIGKQVSNAFSWVTSGGDKTITVRNESLAKIQESNNSKSKSSNVTYSPTYNVKVEGDGDADLIQKALNKSSSVERRSFDDLWKNRLAN